MIRHFIHYLIALFCLAVERGIFSTQKDDFFVNTLPIMSLLSKEKDRLSGMWRQIFSLGIIACAMIISIVPLSAMAADCKAPPEKLQLHFAFDWPITERGNLSEILYLQCGEPENVDRLRQRIDSFFRLTGWPVTQVTWRADSQPGIVEFEVATSQDAPTRRAIMFDIMQTARDDSLIPLFQISGMPEDGRELTTRFVVHQEFVDAVGGRVELQWMRDGKPVPSAYKSRYLLQEADIGRAISVDIRILAGTRVLAHRSLGFDKSIQIGEKAPEIRQAKITGRAELGEKLALEYQFFDRNPEDIEKDSQIIWLRDNFAIPGATARAYQVVRADIGHILSARIIPASQDGQRGVAVTVSLPEKIADRLELQKQNFLTSLLPVSTGQDASVPDSQNISPENVIAALSDPSTELQDTDGLRPRTPGKSDMYLTRGFRIAKGTPRQITGLDIERSDLLRRKELQAIEARFIGRDIEIDTLKEIIDAINLAFKEEGYELSRALLPEQTVSNGRVQIKIVEVRLGDIIVEGNDAVDEGYILEQLGFAPGDFISLATIEESLKSYNATNKSKLTTELAPGNVYGTTDIFIQTEEPDFIELPSISVDNYNKGVSEIVPQSFSATFNNLVNRDDEVNVSVSDGAGTSAYTIGFSTPLGQPGGNLSVNLATAQTKSTVENAELVGYRGSSVSLGVGYSYPLFSATNWSGFSSVSFGRGKNDMVAPSTGDLLAKSQTDKWVFAVPMSYNDGITSLSLSPSYHLIHVSTEIPPSNKWVSKFDMDMSASRFLSPQLTANFSGRYLYTNARAFLNMPGEIISIGGPGSVRAYRPSESSGYRGYFASAELRSDLANWQEVTLPDWLPSIQPYAFIDHVNAREVYGKARRTDKWSGYGVGLTLPTIFDYLSFDTYWAHPLDNSVHEDEKTAYKDDLLQFSLRANIKLN